MKHTILIPLLLLLMACRPSVPPASDEAGHAAAVLPDNGGATLPPNIAPLNFRIQEEGERFVTRLSTHGGHELVLGGQTVDIPVDKWHQLLSHAVGDTLWTDIYVRRQGRWLHFPRIANPVASDSIDPYITYRLVRPAYVTYEELYLAERCTEDFHERIFYDNMPLSQGDQGQCVNCHVPQRQGQTGRSMFHLRQRMGGTMLIDGQQVRKVDLKTDSTISAGVYAAWHPTLNLVAYSVNETAQLFHTLDVQKVEVIDYKSDLVLFDNDRNELRHITRTEHDYESFPTWSPDGRTLYYISTHHEPMGNDAAADLDQHYQSVRYNIYARDFDPATLRFGPSRLVFDAASLGKSASTPRISPDGRWLLFSLADYGQFHIWHRSADLCLMPLAEDYRANEAHETNGTHEAYETYETNETHETYGAYEAHETHETHEAHETYEAPADLNSPESESYHSWSSNGRWILFSSRRDDGNFTRLYISYFDNNGRTHRPLLLPQRRPEYYGQLFRSYNAAEWMTHPLQPTPAELLQAARQQAQPVGYVSSR